jgi:hypothetical protein
MKKCHWQNCGDEADFRLYHEEAFVGYACEQHAFEAGAQGLMALPIKQFKAWGAQGGKKSKRTLTTEQSKEMLAIREQKRKLKQSIDIVTPL